MIVKPPKEEYQKKLYNICSNIPKLPEGEKAIIYDLAAEFIPAHAVVDFDRIDLENYVHNIILLYDKHKSTPIINLVNAFIKKNDLLSISNYKTYLGGKNGTSENITSQQRPWIGEFD